jgi:hypothetical protein
MTSRKTPLVTDWSNAASVRLYEMPTLKIPLTTALGAECAAATSKQKQHSWITIAHLEPKATQKLLIFSSNGKKNITPETSHHSSLLEKIHHGTLVIEKKRFAQFAK